MRDTIKREIFHALIDQIPVMKYFEKTLWNSIFRSNNENYYMIQKEIDEYCSMLYSSVGLDRSNPGSAKSAAHNVIDIFSRVTITPELLIELKFSEDELTKHLMGKGQDILVTAGGVRQRLISQGLRRISRVIILSTVDIPEYKAKLYNHLLVKLK